MKTFTFFSVMLLLSSIGIFAQSGMTIKSGGAVTVNGNTIITPTTFVCGNLLTDARDGKTYNTVLIGTQCWMAQNLNYGNKIAVTDYQTDNNIPEKYCYNNDEANCDVYGGLYQWAEMVQYLNGATNNSSWNPVPEGNVTGICPNGWHVPTNDEWQGLFTFLGGTIVSGGKAKEAGYSHWAAPNTGATNSSGFTALPGGYSMTPDGYYGGLNTGGLFWASSPGDGIFAVYWFFYYGYNYVNSTGMYKRQGCSVRCFKD